MAVHFCISNPCPLCHPAGSYPAASAPFGGAERYWEGRWRDERAHNDALVAALQAIIEANNDFRKSMPDDWDGDLLQDACDDAAKLLVRVGSVK